MTATVHRGTVQRSVPAVTRAVVWRGGHDLAVQQLPVPPLLPGEVLVEVHLATVCGSDRHTVSGRRPSSCPSVLGHEAVGEVVAVGPGGANSVAGGAVTPGDRIVWGVTVPCGTCARCRNGITAKCLRLRKVGHESLNAGWALSGGYAEHIVLPAGGIVVHVPTELDDAVAAPAGCATATVMAVLEKAGDLTGRRVAVVGAGMLGITAVAASVDAGAAEVVAVDPDPHRRDLAHRFGAERVLAAAKQITTVDVVLEFSGSTGALADVLAHLDVGGTAVLAGAVGPVTALRLDPEAVVRQLLTVTGVHNYEPRYLDRAVAFLARSSKRLPWGDLVTAPVPLAAVGDLLTGPASVEPRTSIAPMTRAD